MIDIIFITTLLKLFSPFDKLIVRTRVGSLCVSISVLTARVLISTF